MVLPPPESYTLSLHDALPISAPVAEHVPFRDAHPGFVRGEILGPQELHRVRRDDRKRALSGEPHRRDRKSTRLNSSHRCNSYAVFCLKKKTHTHTTYATTRNN